MQTPPGEFQQAALKTKAREKKKNPKQQYYSLKKKKKAKTKTNKTLKQIQQLQGIAGKQRRQTEGGITTVYHQAQPCSPSSCGSVK